LVCHYRLRCRRRNGFVVRKNFLPSSTRWCQALCACGMTMHSPGGDALVSCLCDLRWKRCKAGGQSSAFVLVPLRRVGQSPLTPPVPEAFPQVIPDGSYPPPSYGSCPASGYPRCTAPDFPKPAGISLTGRVPRAYGVALRRLIVATRWRRLDRASRRMRY
jgi:hypothetical protein